MGNSKPYKLASKLIQIASEVEETFNENYDKVGYFDNKTQDILHEIELGKFNVVSGYQLAKKLKDVRVNRRTAKDENILLERLNDYFKKNPKFKMDMCRIVGEIKKQEDYHENRVYEPRCQEEKYSN